MSYVKGLIDWGLSRDQDGHRDYTAVWLVDSEDAANGPTSVFLTAGLPPIGTLWAFGNDIDTAAFCHPDWTAHKLGPKNESGTLWALEQHFRTRPIKRCQDTTIENPLMEPPKISGSFVKYTKAMTKDRFGKPPLMSSGEPVAPNFVEFDANRHQVSIEMNTLFLPLGTMTSLIDTVNDEELWGMPKRCVKLSEASWQRQIYGVCNYYFTVRYGFDIDALGFDRKYQDRSQLCLKGWSPGSRCAKLDPDVIAPGETLENWKLPKNYECYKDATGENTITNLDGKGRPADPTADPVINTFEYYPEKNMLELFIPTSFT